MSYLPRRVQSSFLETVNLIAVSVVTNGITLGLFALARLIWPEHTPDLARWITERSAYANPRLGYLALWSVAALAVSSAIALLLAGSWVRKIFGRYFNPAIAEVSTWYHIFEHPPKDKAADATYAYVECFLTDGSYSAGRLTWYSTEIDETQDRDLALVAPPPSSESSSEPTSSPSLVDGVVRGNSILILSARDIRRMVVTWVDLPKSDVGSKKSKTKKKSTTRPLRTQVAN